MPDYSQCKTYVIKFYDDDKLIYIGSTVQPLAVRFSGHKKNTNCSLYHYIQDYYNGDFKCCYIELLEYFKCDNKQELNKREEYYINQSLLDPKCLNTISAYISEEQQKEKTDAYQALYRLDNAEKRREYTRQYALEHPEQIKESKKRYNQENQF
jgi:hypothetical protein